MMNNNYEDIDNNAVDPCHLVFEWRTKQACRQCLSYEVTEVNSACLWYQREVTQNPSKECNIYSHQFIEAMKDNDVIS